MAVSARGAVASLMDIVLCMAPVAIAWERRTDARYVTRLTAYGRVPANKREACPFVIESLDRPARLGVTRCAIPAKLAFVSIVRSMARNARCRDAFPFLRSMTRCARFLRMRPLQWKTRRGMIELGGLPVGGHMAGCAG